MNWRDLILDELDSNLSRFIVAADPDRLLTEERLLEAIQDKGFDVLVFEDEVSFRFLFEKKYRTLWDNGEGREMAILVTVPEENLDGIPYDLLKAGRMVSFSLASLFPDLSNPVVRDLDRAYLGVLHQAQTQSPPGHLGDAETKNYILLHVFETAPELVKSPSDLLHMLLRKHYRNLKVPTTFDEWFIQRLRQTGNFDDWPLEAIVPDKDSFFDFLQERWRPFLAGLSGDGDASTTADGFTLPGPFDIPFDHDDVRIYIDNLFLEGFLRPVQLDDPGNLADKWFGVGIANDPEANWQIRLEGLLGSLEGMIPSPDGRYNEWLIFSYRWAELSVLWHGAKTAERNQFQRHYGELRDRVDVAFMEWVTKHYGGLHSQPPLPPVMLHHIPRFLHRTLEVSSEKKVALVVVDGLALDQWIILRDELRDQRPDISLHEEAVFAWIPTITSVSRQAAFSGKPPIHFSGSIDTTSKEPALWSMFWADHGFLPNQVEYLKGLGEASSLSKVEEVVSHPQVRAVGLVIDKVDKIMHGMELGMDGMHNQVRQWAESGFLAELMDRLLDHGVTVFLTSDHGNIEATGMGHPMEGAVAELRGERARVYHSENLRDRVRSDFPNTVAWPPIGLPDDYLPLLASGRSAFIREGEKIIGHGGASIEEVIVPFIRVGKRQE